MNVTQKDIKALAEDPTTPPLLKCVCDKCISLYHTIGRINNERNDYRDALISIEITGRKAAMRATEKPERNDGINEG